MAEVIATGPAPTEPNPFSGLAQIGGIIAGQNFQQARLEQERQERARRLSEMLATTVGAGGQTQAQPPQSPPSQPGGVEATPPIQSSPGVPGGAPAISAGASPTGDVRGDMATLQRDTTPVGQMFRSLNPDQQARFVRSLQEGGANATDIVGMFTQEPSDFQFKEVNGQIIRFQPRTGEMEPVGRIPQQPQVLSTDELRSQMIQQVRAGQMEADEFRRLDRLMREGGAGKDPIQVGNRLVRINERGEAEVLADFSESETLSTDELQAQMLQEVRAGQMPREEFQQLNSLLQQAKGDSSLTGTARTAILLNRRKRGETTGTMLDTLSPERAAEVESLILSQPQRYKIITDPQGRQFIHDTSTGKRTLLKDQPPLAQGQQQEPSGVGGQEAPGETLLGKLVTGRGELGFMGKLQEFGNIIKPQFGGQLTEPQRTELETGLTQLRENMTSVLRENRRLLSVQVDEIRSLVPNADSWLESTPNAIASLLSLRKRLEEDKQRNLQIANDPKTPAAEAEQRAKLVRDLEGILETLRLPASTLQQAAPQEAFAFAQALTPESAGGMDPAAVDALVQKLSTEQLGNLNPEVQQALMDRLPQPEQGGGGSADFRWDPQQDRLVPAE